MITNLTQFEDESIIPSRLLDCRWDWSKYPRTGSVPGPSGGYAYGVAVPPFPGAVVVNPVPDAPMEPSSFGPIESTLSQCAVNGNGLDFVQMDFDPTTPAVGDLGDVEVKLGTPTKKLIIVNCVSSVIFYIHFFKLGRVNGDTGLITFTGDEPWIEMGATPFQSGAPVLAIRFAKPIDRFYWTAQRQTGKRAALLASDDICAYGNIGGDAGSPPA